MKRDESRPMLQPLRTFTIGVVAAIALLTAWQRFRRERLRSTASSTTAQSADAYSAKADRHQHTGRR